MCCKPFSILFLCTMYVHGYICSTACSSSSSSSCTCAELSCWGTTTPSLAIVLSTYDGKNQNMRMMSNICLAQMDSKTQFDAIFICWLEMQWNLLVWPNALNIFMWYDYEGYKLLHTEEDWQGPAFEWECYNTPTNLGIIDPNCLSLNHVLDTYSELTGSDWQHGKITCIHNYPTTNGFCWRT